MFDHPVLLNPSDCSRIRHKIIQNQWARAAFEQLVSLGTDFLRAVPEIPPVGGGWWHDYFCPTCAIELSYRPEFPHHHVCPGCDTIHSGASYDSAWRTLTQRNLAEGIRNLAILYTITRNPKYAAIPRRILLKLVEVYPTYTPHNPTSKDAYDLGRAMNSALNEAVWGITIGWTYFLLARTGVLDQGGRKLIETRLLREIMLHLRTNNEELSNHQAWIATGTAILAMIVGEQAVLSEAVNGKWGIKDLVSRGVNGDGFWWEGSDGYQVYVLSALLALYESHHIFYQEPYPPFLDSMMDLLLKVELPDHTLPQLNDYEPILPPPHFRHLEQLAARTQSDSSRTKFMAALASIYQQHQRTSLEALVYGVDMIPRSANVPSAVALHLQNSGLVVYKDSKRYVALKYASPKAQGLEGVGWHSHPDRMEVILYQNGRLILGDPGVSGYSTSHTLEWYKQTIAHNTALVDGHSQAQTDCQLEEFQVRGDSEINARIRATELYPGVEIIRGVKSTKDRFEDSWIFRSVDEHQYDVVYHLLDCIVEPKSVPVNRSPRQSATLGHPGIHDAAELPLGYGLSELVLMQGVTRQRIAVSVNGESGFRVFLGKGLGPAINPWKSTVSLVIRCSGQHAQVSLRFDFLDLMSMPDYVRKAL